jgi:hypothetical protein
MHQGKEKERFAADRADLRRSREFYFFHQRQSARSAAKYLLASFLRHQGKEKEFFAADCADLRRSRGFISSISVNQRDQRLKYLLASFLRHQGKEKEFLYQAAMSIISNWLRLALASETMPSSSSATESIIQASPHWRHVMAGTFLTTTSILPLSTVKVVMP